MKLRILLLVFVLFVLVGCKRSENPNALIITEDASIEIELFIDQAPITVKNFMKYCQEGRFKDASFYRSVTLQNQGNREVKIEVLQGGLKKDDHPNMLPPIPHESTKQTGILHQHGVISMARYEPGTATSEFFICIGDQPSLDAGGNRNPDGAGFAAFGKVVKGMDAIMQYHRQKTNKQYLDPPIRILDIILVD